VSAVATGFRYLLTEDIAERYGATVRWIDEESRCGRLPHRKLPGRRRRLYLLEELDAFDNGAPLETVTLPNGGKHVRPKAAA
jgi:hypothetical protein